MASIAIRALSFLLPYSLRNNSGIPNIRGRGFEIVLKINNQKGLNNFWGFKNRIHLYFDYLLLHFLSNTKKVSEENTN